MQTRLSRKKSLRRQKRNSPVRIIKRILFVSFFTLFTLFVGGIIFFFATDTGEELREWAAGTLLTTQHDYWAKYTLISNEKLEELKREINNPVIINSAAPEQAVPVMVPKPEKKRELIEIEEVSENRGSYNFRGKLMFISDPTRVHLVVTTRKDDRGDLLDEFVKKHNAIGIVNASGFYDPTGYGRGKQAFGVVIKDGKILQRDDPKSGDSVLGITFDGKMITGKYTADQLIKLGVRDAMSFRPQLIVNGKNMFANQSGKAWGNQPRTAVGQKADGTVVFLVIDGRQPGHSIGASMKDVADLLEQRGVVNAMAMDGGSSSMMLYNGEPITKTACPYERGRFLPNAWAVY